MFRTIVQNIRIYITTNWTIGLFSTLSGLLLWCLSIIWNNNNDKISDIAKATESTAQSMHELVIFVKEDRVEINNLKNQVHSLEEWRAQHEHQVQEFYQTYDLHKRK